MSSNERQTLGKAMELLRTKWTKSQSDVIYRRYFSDLSRATIKSLLKDPKKIFSALPATRKAVLDFYILETRESSDSYKLYDLLLRTFGRKTSDQEGFERYVGIYRFYRKSSVSQELVTGEVSFCFHKDLNIPYHFHAAQQLVDFRSGAELRDIDHEGPVFMFANRMYVIGVGESYLRQMIFRRVDNTKREPLTGMLLSERLPGNEPIAVRIVMYHSEFTYQPSQDEILRFLENEKG
jgi:hypothetical protein